ncbi:hypothetical protein P175DRAFT_0501188 [Aspergillus ochraceoroseus IBT 24754]|nr:uncharacterized protein P175DRAFT_0501188 [Aspergillus ochraceoroseus IBT 24754]PTU20568.1 hypothetical protein P175DRAFT_0501188 [Aspergillus ochraceoroseus IBT 24754]
MEGVPEDVIQAHNQRVATQFQQAEAERQAITGNPPSGTSVSGGQPAKKPKLESISDLKKRLAEHKAKKAETLAGGSSGEVTPVGAGQTPSVGGGFAPSPTTAAAPALTYPPPYAGAGSPYQQTASPVYPTFSPGQPQYPPSSQFSTPTGYSPQPGQPAPPYGNTPPPLPSQQPQISQSTAFPPRPGSLPAAPSLPQRPAIAAPQVNAYQMQQMHMGHPIPGAPGVSNGEKTEPTAFSSSVDDLISGAAREADKAAASAPKADGAEEKATKKDKSKQSRLVYSDNETSPEEKMAGLPRYAFVSHRPGEPVLQEIPPAAAVGAVVDPAQS